MHRRELVEYTGRDDEADWIRQIAAIVAEGVVAQLRAQGCSRGEDPATGQPGTGSQAQAVDEDE